MSTFYVGCRVKLYDAYYFKTFLHGYLEDIYYLRDGTTANFCIVMFDDGKVGIIQAPDFCLLMLEDADEDAFRQNALPTIHRPRPRVVVRRT